MQTKPKKAPDEFLDWRPLIVFYSTLVFRDDVQEHAALIMR